MKKKEDVDIVLLRTGLFDNSNQVIESVSGIGQCATKIIELQPERMQDADWDVVVGLVLHAGKVVTV